MNIIFLIVRVKNNSDNLKKGIFDSEISECECRPNKLQDLLDKDNT